MALLWQLPSHGGHNGETESCTCFSTAGGKALPRCQQYPLKAPFLRSSNSIPRLSWMIWPMTGSTLSCSGFLGGTRTYLPIQEM